VRSWPTDSPSHAAVGWCVLAQKGGLMEQGHQRSARQNERVLVEREEDSTCTPTKRVSKALQAMREAGEVRRATDAKGNVLWSPSLSSGEAKLAGQTPA
jgi:hypothetical protein